MLTGISVIASRSEQYKGRRIECSSTALVKEEARAVWTWTYLEPLAQDCRYAVRTMAANKTFSMLAILSLALGIGANTAIYSFMDSLLLRSLFPPSSSSGPTPARFSRAEEDI